MSSTVEARRGHAPRYIDRLPEAGYLHHGELAVLVKMRDFAAVEVGLNDPAALRATRSLRHTLKPLRIACCQATWGWSVQRVCATAETAGEEAYWL